ncbi:MAG: TRAP transporter large permease subunit, partial [Synergistota bacterium]|nr:TRAP transporter large permease subunit [Synergistota bacterium]
MSAPLVYSFFVGKFIFCEIRWCDLPRILLDSGITTATVLFIISTANVFAWVIAANMIPLRLANVFLSITDNPIFF